MGDDGWTHPAVAVGWATVIVATCAAIVTAGDMANRDLAMWLILDSVAPWVIVALLGFGIAQFFDD